MSYNILKGYDNQNSPELDQAFISVNQTVTLIKYLFPLIKICNHELAQHWRAGL